MLEALLSGYPPVGLLDARIYTMPNRKAIAYPGLNAGAGAHQGANPWPAPRKSAMLYAIEYLALSSCMIPAVVGEVFHFAPPQQFQGTRGLCVCAGDQNCSQQTQWSDVGAAKGGAGD